MRRKTAVAGLQMRVLTLAVSSVFSVNVWAASDAERIADLEKKLENSLSQIEKLSARVGDFEKNNHNAVTGVPVADAQDARLATIERNVAQMAESSTRAIPNLGVPLHGFSDLGYASSGKKSENRKGGFFLGNVDLYLTPEFGDHVKALVEINFDWGPKGVFTVDTERMQLGYTFNDALTVWGGRFHTPFGYYNTAFHHGAQIQSSIMRPKMVAFEDHEGFMPTHTVGVWATGQMPLGSGKVEYDAYVGNGGRIVDGVLDFNAVKDDNVNKMFGGSLRYRFSGALDGLITGVHGLSEKVSSFSGSTLDSTTQVNMVGAYAFYDANDWEVISEYYRFRNKDQTNLSGTHGSWAGFVQVGKQFFGNTLPFVRYEKASLNQADNYFSSQVSGRSYVRQVVGLRYDLNPKTALKFELSRSDESRDGGEKYNQALVQAAVRF